MSETLANLLHETRRFAPPAGLAEDANVTVNAYAAAGADRLGFWERQADRLHWHERFTEVLDWSNPPFAKWFADGRLNAAYNCLDRHIEAGRGDRVAIHWEGEPGDTRTITYGDLHRSVCQAANALLALGVQPRGPGHHLHADDSRGGRGDARLRAHRGHSLGGVRRLLRRRAQGPDPGPGRDAGDHRRWWLPARQPRARSSPLWTKPSPSARPSRNVLVVRRTGQDVAWTEGRDLWWHDTVEQASAEHTAEAFEAEHPLFILYTSGTTAKPKGILHTTGGFLTQVSWTHHAVFDLKPETDIFWCTADIGWVTGHSYIVYGPLSNGATQVMYEGTPDTPHRGRFWELIEKYGVTILYTAPTAIRTFAKWGDDIPAQFNLSSLRLLGSVGEPINPEAWMWYRAHIGGDRCPIVDTWWQTETGAIMISPLPGVTQTKPGSAMRPLPGITADVVDETGAPVPNGGGGYLVVRDPWPSMLRTIWGDDQRYIDTYWSRFPGMYFPGDGAKRDDDGDLWLLGRVDDVMLISGHNISTTEVESALVSHPKVAESAVVGATDPTTGQAIVAFVILRGGALTDDGTAEGDALVQELREHVARTLGPIAKPRQIMLVPELPKTRSGKIMRRLLRDVAENRSLGDVTTLQDSSVMELISSGLKANQSGED